MPDQAVLHDILEYNPETGSLTWKWRDAKYFTDKVQYGSWNTQYAGKPAFAQVRPSRLEGRLFGKEWFAHRIAWKHFYGTDPAVIDHINGNCHDNRIANLRSVDVATNNRNKPTLRRNTSGFVGVYKRRGKWLASIKAQGKVVCLGTFTSKVDAVHARVQAEAEYGFHPNTGRDIDTLEPRNIPQGPVLNTAARQALARKIGKERAALTRMRRPAPATAASGHVGVYERDSVWCAYIKRDGRRRWIGTFSTKDAAIAARKMAEDAFEKGGLLNLEKCAPDITVGGTRLRRAGSLRTPGSNPSAPVTES